MLTKVYKITKIISSLSLLIGFIAIPIGGIIWWKRNRKRKGLWASFCNADKADLMEEELMSWIHNYLWVVFFYIDMWC